MSAADAVIAAWRDAADGQDVHLALGVLAATASDGVMTSDEKVQVFAAVTGDLDAHA